MFTNKKYLYTTATNNYYREYELNINKIKFMKFFTNKIQEQVLQSLRKLKDLTILSDFHISWYIW